MMNSIGIELPQSMKDAIDKDIQQVKALVELANAILERWGARMEIEIVEAKK